ncbi:MAG: HIT family protein [Candidatus Parvarchaeota archaeon]|nr:HIT family protein [Candidatus Parvarchaeota archaeon]
MECMFCNVINIDSNKFYEDDLFMAIYNIRPVTRGHSLVIPKRHVNGLLSLDEEEKKNIMSFIRKTVFIALKFADAYQFDVTLQEGKDAGQSINHLHFHVIPRKADDELSKYHYWLAKSEHNLENTRTQELAAEDREKALRELRFIAKSHAAQLESL